MFRSAVKGSFHQNRSSSVIENDFSNSAVRDSEVSSPVKVQVVQEEEKKEENYVADIFSQFGLKMDLWSGNNQGGPSATDSSGKPQAHEASGSGGIFDMFGGSSAAAQGLPKTKDKS